MPDTPVKNPPVELIVEGDGELPPEAIAALAKLLLDLDDQEQEPAQS